MSKLFCALRVAQGEFFGLGVGGFGFVVERGGVGARHGDRFGGRRREPVGQLGPVVVPSRMRLPMARRIPGQSFRLSPTACRA